MTPAALMDELIDGCVAGLSAHLSATPPTLYDPHRKKPTPSSHYAHCGLALALFWRRPTVPAWEAALTAYLAIPAKELGHHPFNRLLLLLLRAALPNNADAAEHVRAALKRCPLAAAYPSNNWTLLAQLCRILETPQYSTARDTAIAAFKALLARWMTDAGGFIDYPAEPSDKRGATPIAYHHKALLLTTIAVCHANAVALKSELQALFDWAAQWIDEAGLCGGFGRTNHGLFGDACLLASLTLLRRSGATQCESIESAIGRIVTRLKQQQREDGLIWLTPAGAHGWDSYMYLSVYDAWFAGILAWANAVPLHEQTLFMSLTTPGSAPFMDESAGLIAWRTQTRGVQLEVMISTTGQPPQGFSSDQVELRYAGGTVFNLVVGAQPMIPPQVRIKRTTLQHTPALAGSIPIFEHREQLYGLVDLTVKRIETSQDQLVVELCGIPTALTANARGQGFLSSIIDAVDWRFFGSRFARRRALQRAPLDEVHCDLQITVSAAKRSLHRALRVTLTGPTPVTFLNPAGWSMIREHTNDPDGQSYPSSLPYGHCSAHQARRLAPGSHDFAHTLDVAV